MATAIYLLFMFSKRFSNKNVSETKQNLEFCLFRYLQKYPQKANKIFFLQGVQN